MRSQRSISIRQSRYGSAARLLRIGPLERSHRTYAELADSPLVRGGAPVGPSLLLLFGPFARRGVVNDEPLRSASGPALLVNVTARGSERLRAGFLALLEFAVDLADSLEQRLHELLVVLVDRVTERAQDRLALTAE